MATSYTPRLSLPEMADGEGSGYVTFNDLGRMLDGFVQTVVQSKTVTTPPGSPADGQCWYVPAGATGAWIGQDGKLAQWYNGLWWFYTPASFVVWVVDEEFLWVVDQPGIHAYMALAGTPVAHSLTTTPTAFQIADESVNASNAPSPTTVDLANSRFTVNDHNISVPVQINAQAAIQGSGNNVQYVMGIYKNGGLQTHLRSAFTVTNQSPNAALVIPGGVADAQAGDQFEVRFWTSSGTQGISFEAFSFSVMPIK